MKIGYIVSMKNGLPAFNYREIKYLVERGVDIVVLPTKYDEGTYMPPEGVKVGRYNPFFTLIKQLMYFILHPILYCRLFFHALKHGSLVDLFIAWDFSRYKRDIDHIHSQCGDHKLFIGFYLNKILDLPFTVTIHSHSLWINPNLKLFEQALEEVDGIVTISNYNKKVLSKKYKVPEDKIEVIRLYPDPDMIGSKETKKIMIVGQWTERKGHKTLLKAVKKMDRDDVKLWVVGGGIWDREGYVDVEKEAKRLGIRDKVVIFGKVPDDVLKELYRSCDIYCLPSETGSDGNKEGIPVTIMEAMACGKPVVSTYHAGIPEIVPDEFLVESGDYEALADILGDIIAEKYDMGELGEKNIEIIKNMYSEKNVDELIKYFQKFLKGK